MNAAGVTDPPPLLTLLDLWYTAYGERGVYISWESLEDNVFDDWLMQNMTLVVNRFMRERAAKQWVLYEGPYGLRMHLDWPTSSVRVVVFMENKDGNRRK